MVEYQPTERYYVAKHFYRYIRPGAVMIDAVSDDAEVMAVASVHDGDGTMTVVLVNPGTSAKDVALTGLDGLTFAQYRSSQSEQCAAVGTVTGTCQLPARSVTTLFAQDYVSSVGRLQRALRVSTRRAGSRRLMSLSGRALGSAPGTLRQIAAGVFVAHSPEREHAGLLTSGIRKGN